MQPKNSVEITVQQIPDWLTQLRECIASTGITHEQLTSVLGVETRGAVGHYLNFRRQMTIKQFSDLCREVGAEPNTVLGFNEVLPEKGWRDQESSQAAHLTSAIVNMKQCYRKKIQACDERLMQLRADNRHLARKGDAWAEDRQQTLNTIRIVVVQRQCYLQAEADIAAIEDELGLG